jgi:hypothetical protein
MEAASSSLHSGEPAEGVCASVLLTRQHYSTELARVVLQGACSLLVSASAALAAVPPIPTAAAAPATANQLHYQQQQQHIPASLPAYSAAPAPPLLASTTQSPDAQQQWGQEQQQHGSAQELQQLAQWDWPRNHWLATVLFIGAINVLGLQAVLKVLQASRDSE